LSLKEKNRELILSVIKQSDPNYKIKDNVYYIGSKAFVANSVIQWILERIDNGDLQSESAQFYIDAVNKYIVGEVNLRWENGDLIIEGL
tara:strand:- start:11088 stop:11354 length:267 start_codon:yes stop_codon:yes gene_type:complete